MLKKNIKPVLLAGALALATAVSPVFADTYINDDENKTEVKTVVNGSTFPFTKNYTFADVYTVTNIPHVFNYSIQATDADNSPLFTMSTITFDATEEDTDGSETNATKTIRKTGTASVDITKNQNSATKNIIPGEYKYTIKEENSSVTGVTYDSKEYCATVYVQNIKDGNELETTHVGVAAITLQEIIKNGTSDAAELGTKLDSLTFANSYLETEDNALSVEKIVSGNYGDKTKYFHFTGTVTIPSTADAASLHTINVTQKNNNNEFESKTLRLSKGTNSIDFYLRSGEKLNFGTLPVGTTYSFNEADAASDGYTTKISGADSAENTNATPNNAATGTVTKEANDADAVVFTNTKTGSPVTGVIVNNMPYIALLGASGAGLVVLAASKKRSK